MSFARHLDTINAWKSRASAGCCRYKTVRARSSWSRTAVVFDQPDLRTLLSSDLLRRIKLSLTYSYQISAQARRCNRTAMMGCGLRLSPNAWSEPTRPGLLFQYRTQMIFHAH